MRRKWMLMIGVAVLALVGFRLLSGGSAPAVARKPLGSLTISAGAVGPVKLGMSQAEVLAALGPPDMDEEGTSKYFAEGMELFITRGKLEAISVFQRTPDAERRGFNNFEEFNGTTDKGIKVGATKEQVKAAHGAPTSTARVGAEDQWVYTTGSARMTFAFTPKNVLRSIFLSAR